MLCFRWSCDPYSSWGNFSGHKLRWPRHPVCLGLSVLNGKSCILENPLVLGKLEEFSPLLALTCPNSCLKTQQDSLNLEEKQTSPNSGPSRLQLPSLGPSDQCPYRWALIPKSDPWPALNRGNGLYGLPKGKPAYVSLHSPKPRAPAVPLTPPELPPSP